MAFDLESPEAVNPEEWARRIEAELQQRQQARDFYAIKRFVVRTLRLAVGLVSLLIAFWPLGFALETLGQPFSSLSPLGLLAGLFAGLIGLALIVAAFAAAFGEGESREMHDARIEGEMRVAIEQEFRWRRENAQASSAYEAGKAASRLLKRWDVPAER